VPAQITPDRAKARLDKLMPEWRYGLFDDDAKWIDEWRAASGDSRATAYRMRAMAVALDRQEHERILALYYNGHISAEALKVQLFDYMSERVKAQGHEPLFDPRDDDDSEEAMRQRGLKLARRVEPMHLYQIPGTNIFTSDPEGEPLLKLVELDEPAAG